MDTHAPNLKWLLWSPKIPLLLVLVGIAAIAVLTAISLSGGSDPRPAQVSTVADLPGEVTMALWSSIEPIVVQEPGQNLPASLENMLAANWPAKRVGDSYVVLVPYQNRLADQWEYTLLRGDEDHWRAAFMLNEKGIYEGMHPR